MVRKYIYTLIHLSIDPSIYLSLNHPYIYPSIQQTICLANVRCFKIWNIDSPILLFFYQFFDPYIYLSFDTFETLLVYLSINPLNPISINPLIHISIYISILWIIYLSILSIIYISTLQMTDGLQPLYAFQNNPGKSRYRRIH